MITIRNCETFIQINLLARTARLAKLPDGDRRSEMIQVQAALLSNPLPRGARFKG